MASELESEIQSSHLYLDGTKNRCDVMLEHSALLIKQQGKSDLLHPIKRINRITAYGDIWWQSEALAAIAQAGAPLGILDNDGRLKALLMPQNLRRSSLADQLKRLEKHKDWAKILDIWLRNKISILANKLKIANPSEAAMMGWAVAEKYILEIVKSADPNISRARRYRFTNRLRSFSQLLAQKHLRDMGCPNSWLGTDPFPQHNLVPIFSQIIVWRFAALLNNKRLKKIFINRLINDINNKSQTILLSESGEKAASLLSQKITADILDLHRHLLDVNSELKYISFDF